MFLSRCLPPGLFHLLFPGVSDPENWWLLVPTVGVLCGLGYGSLLSNTHTHLGCDQDLPHWRLHQTGIVLLQHESKHVAFPFIFNMFWVFKENYRPLLAHINHCYVFTLIYIFLFWIFISKTFVVFVCFGWLIVSCSYRVSVRSGPEVVLTLRFLFSFCIRTSFCQWPVTFPGVLGPCFPFPVTESLLSSTASVQPVASTCRLSRSCEGWPGDPGEINVISWLS